MQEVERSLSLMHSGAISHDVFIENLLAEIDYLKRKEKTQILDAWMAGNRAAGKNGKMLPKDPRIYFDEKYE